MRATSKENELNYTLSLSSIVLKRGATNVAHLTIRKDLGGLTLSFMGRPETASELRTPNEGASPIRYTGTLARIMHKPPAMTADMAVLPGVLGSRTLRRTDKYASGPSPCGYPVARPSPRSRYGVSRIMRSRANSGVVTPIYRSLTTTRVMSSSWGASPRKVCKVSMMTFWIASADSAAQLRMIWRRRSRPNISRAGLQVS